MLFDRLRLRCIDYMCHFVPRGAGLEGLADDVVLREVELPELWMRQAWNGQDPLASAVRLV